MTKRLGERKVEVLLGTSAVDLRIHQGRVVGVDTDRGSLDADVVVVAIDPRGLPVLAPHVSRTMPAIPPVLCHLGLSGELPDLPHEVVLHGDPTLVVRTGGTAPAGRGLDRAGPRPAVGGRDRRRWPARGIDVRRQVEVRVDRSPARPGRGAGRARLRHALAGPRDDRPQARGDAVRGGVRAPGRTPRPAPGCRSSVSPRPSRPSGSVPPRRPWSAGPRRSPASPWSGSACRSAGPGAPPASSSSHSSVAIAMPSARTAAGSPSKRATRATTSRGHLASGQLGHPRDLREVGDRHDARAGSGSSTPTASRPLDEREVVLGAEEQLGDRELRAGVLLGLQHPRVVPRRSRPPGAPRGTPRRRRRSRRASVTSSTSSLA